MNATSPRSDCADRLFEVGLALARTVRAEVRSHDGTDLTLPQVRTLGFLKRNPAASVSDVADEHTVSLPAASRVVDGLVERGLVERVVSAEDRRRVELTVTDDGLTELAAVRAVATDRIARELASLPARDVEHIARALTLLEPVFAPGRAASAEAEAR